MNKISLLFTTVAATIFLAACGNVEGPRVGTYYDYPDKNDTTLFFKREYNAQHILKQEIRYVNKKRNGVSKEFYDDGKLKMEITYEEGLRNGPSKLYYESGQLNMVINYKGEKKEGLTQVYYKNGVLAYAAVYSDGEQVPGIREFRESGEEVEQPEIILKKSGRTLLEISLSKKRSNVEMFWYASPEATTGLPINSVTADGVGQLSTHAGQYVRVRVKYTTNFGNQGLLEAETKM